MSATPPGAAVRRIALLANPAAGCHDAAALSVIADRLRATGADVAIVLSRARGDLAREAARLDVDVIAIAGGDGTVNEVVGALAARTAPRPPIAVIPQGTANVLAHEYGLPRRPAAIAAMIAAGRRAPLHLGLAGTDGAARPFFLMTSAGFDADIVHAVEARTRRRFKKLAFLVAAIRRGPEPRPAVVATVTPADGSAAMRVSAVLAVVAKSSRYGGPFRLSRAVAAAEPGLRFVALRRGGVGRLLAAGLRLVAGRLDDAPNVVSIAAAHVRLEAGGRDARVPVQIDGEPAGSTPVEVWPAATALELIVP